MKTKFVISEQFRGCRLDKALAMMFEDHSRSTLQSWIDEGRIYVNEQQPSRRLLVVGGERVSIDFPQPKSHAWTSENIPLDILYEDEQLLVVNKPAGLVVHPGAGNSSGTLLNGLLHHCAELAQLPRAGIVHRLDKNTSGLLVVAKTEVSRLRLVKQFKKRTVGREYLAIVIGRLISGGTHHTSNRSESIRQAKNDGRTWQTRGKSLSNRVSLPRTYFASSHPRHWAYASNTRPLSVCWISNFGRPGLRTPVDYSEGG